jgi:hypothetical protein
MWHHVPQLEKQIPGDPHEIPDTGASCRVGRREKCQSRLRRLLHKLPQTVTDYIYKNTIERLINNLILAL